MGLDYLSVNVLVQYRRTALKRLGAEWLTEAKVDQDTHLYSEFFQPLNEKRALVRHALRPGRPTDTRAVFDNGNKIADYLLGAARAGLP